MKIKIVILLSVRPNSKEDCLNVTNRSHVASDYKRCLQPTRLCSGSNRLNIARQHLFKCVSLIRIYVSVLNDQTSIPTLFSKHVCPSSSHNLHSVSYFITIFILCLIERNVQNTYCTIDKISFLCTDLSIKLSSIFSFSKILYFPYRLEIK